MKVPTPELDASIRNTGNATMALTTNLALVWSAYFPYPEWKRMLWHRLEAWVARNRTVRWESSAYVTPNRRVTKSVTFAGNGKGHCWRK